MSLNTEFVKIMFNLSKEDLRKAFGKKMASKLLKEHIDVTHAGGRQYFLHWVKCPEIGLNKDLHNEDTASCVNEARSYAISNLLTHLGKVDDDGEVIQCQ